MSMLELLLNCARLDQCKYVRTCSWWWLVAVRGDGWLLSVVCCADCYRCYLSLFVIDDGSCINISMYVQLAGTDAWKRSGSSPPPIASGLSARAVTGGNSDNAGLHKSCGMDGLGCKPA